MSLTGKEIEIKNHFNRIAEQYDYWKKKNSYYYSLLKDFYKKNIPVGSAVVEFGCATADILSACRPSKGLGIDISEKLITLAKHKHPEYEFKIADAQNFSCPEKFDYCIMSDLIDHLWNIPQAIESSRDVLNNEGRLIITSINPLWNPVLGLAERLKLKMPEGPHCFLPNSFIEFFCQAKGFRIISKGALIFIPIKIPFLSFLLNSLIPSVPILNRFCLVQTLIAEKIEPPRKDFSYSILIPAYNEEENIEECVRRIPKLSRDYEILVIDDGSIDSTPRILERLKGEIKNLRTVRLAKNSGKARAIEEGIKNSLKDVIIILDADMSVAPEDINLFIEPIELGLAEFINGTRLIYNMEKDAMEQIKRIANFLLAALLSLVLKSRITDTLCGTKAFFKRDFEGIRISGERWGDLVLLANAKIKKLRIAEVPVRYYARRAGHSKMRFLSDGLKFVFYTLITAFKPPASK